MKYSIITIVLNDPVGFALTADSIVKQRFRDFEWIVIDGMSKPETISVIDAYKKYIDILVSEKDDGVYDAMSKGIALATGEWTNFMNAGDRFATSRVLDSLKPDPGTDVMYGSVNWCNNNAPPVHVPTKPIAELWRGITFSHQSVFCRTSLLKRLGFNQRFRIVADYDFYLRALAEGARFTDQGLTIADVEAGGLSDRNFYKRTLERFRAAARHYGVTRISRHYFDLLIGRARKDLAGKTRARGSLEGTTA